MKRFPCAVCFLFCLSLWSAGAFAADREVRDERGASVTLAQVDGNFYRYRNARFAFGVDVPALFTTAALIPDNNDGIILEDAEGAARFRASGGNLIEEKSLERRFEEAQKDLGAAPAYAHLGKDFFVISRLGDGAVHYRKTLFGKDTWCEVELSYPESRKKEFDPLVERVAESLAWTAR